MPPKGAPDFKKGKPGFSFSALKRVIKMLREYYPVLFPTAIACIIFCAVTATLPAIFQQQVIAGIEDWYLTGDWDSASKVILPKVFLLCGFYCFSIVAVTLQTQLMPLKRLCLVLFKNPCVI